VGLLSIDHEKSYPGYNLFYPFHQPDVYLLNGCGEIVHTWPGDVLTRPGNAARVMPNGNLVKGVFNTQSIGDPIWAGGGGESIEIRSWENELLWSFTLNDSSNRLHHDFSIMPNGNLLVIAWEAKSHEEAIAAGRDPNLLAEHTLWPDQILEINPALDSVVWEWHAWDHLVQEVDASKNNYGVVSEHPELIDLNYVYYGSVRDWLHTNSIDYHPELDLIMLSVAKFHELWIIDHSTTNAEAASHTGGTWGRGGDLLFRWGNPEAYNKGDSSHQQLFFQHDAHWLGDGSIALFNNRVSTQYSTVNVLVPEIDMENLEFRSINGRFLPQDFDRTITHPEPEEMYSPGLSSAQFLPNNNILVLAGNSGYAFELTPDAMEVVWEYKNPLVNGSPAMQGNQVINNLVFRFDRYPLDYDAFVGKDLSPKGYIEINPDTAFCSLMTSVRDQFPIEDLITIEPNPSFANSTIVINLRDRHARDYAMYNLQGQLLYGGLLNPGENVLPPVRSAGIFILRVGRYAKTLFVLE
jgi:hypothetical protein